MQKMQKSIFINAPREKVWDIMLSADSYSEWTKAFHEGSYFKGDWSEGSKIIFVGPNEQGGEEGMVSMIRQNKPHEYISIEHIGIYKDGVEDTESEAARKWSPAFENYTFTEKDGGTELTIDQDIEDEYKEMFEKMWDAALERLKQLAESN